MSPAVLFHAVIVPHRSLSRRGLLWVMALVGGAVTLSGLRFVLIGAWPVLPFSIVETVLAVTLLAVNARRGRASEVVILTGEAVTITRTDASGRLTQTRRLPHAWLNVVLEERPGAVSRLLLAQRGEREEIGAVLGEEQKRALARSLNEALWRMRNPVFDNPQLRDDGGTAAG
ncbi:MAG TPA: DUF2244 domain-containing protein [Acetobacteraceae bacterium]|nr:DUF2244 domain-containing protein [Acetobacteraceae bacterium]